MAEQYIYIKGIRYYYFNCYNTYQQARNKANELKKTHNTRYFILKTENGFWNPTINYKLYFNKIIVF